MSLAIKYESLEDAKLRLLQTVVLYRNAPVQITGIMNGEGDDIFRVLFTELPVARQPAPELRKMKRVGDIMVFDEEVKAEKRKYISSKHFDIAPFKMGYVNRPNNSGAFYCSRLPNRVQKQGLHHENFIARDNFGTVVGWPEFLACKEVPAMAAGHYPTFDQAVKGLEKTMAVAFNREFCLVKDEVVPELIFLYHKGAKVGMFSSRHQEVSLGKKFVCLKESLEEMRLKVGVC